MKKKYFLPLLVIVFCAQTSSAADIQANVSYEGDTFNFELSGQKNWDYDLKRVKSGNQTKVQLFVKSLDAAVVSQIRNITNPFVQSINVVPKAIDNKWMIEFVLKSNRIETFDYLTDQPSKLIVDFYESESPIDQINSLPKSAPAKTAPKKVALEVAEDKVDRAPADVDYLKVSDDANQLQASLIGRSGLFDGGDSQFRRFMINESDYNEEAVIRSRSNYYLKFPVLETEFSFWKKIRENQPEYEISPKSADENKQARLLKILFTKKRSLVFLQTYDWFTAKYPNSQYNEMLAYMRGDVFVQLWREKKDNAFYDKAQEAYRAAIEKYPDSPLSERASLMTGLLAQDRQDYMFSVRRLNQHIQNKKYEGKTSVIYAQLAMAYAYSKMKRLDDALNLFNQIEKTTKDSNILAEIAVRRGDAYFHHKKFAEAISHYDKAAQQYPLVSKLFPSAFFNKMEALFWNAKYRESHKAALEFAKFFPSHDYAPYAMTRVGELLEIMGADQAKAVGAYLETHFRYGNSPKTIIAKLHLLSTRMKGMKPEELEQAIKQMDELEKKSELDNVDQFKVAMMADGYSKRGEYKKAIETLSKFYQDNPNRPDVTQVTERIVKNIGDEMKRLIDAEDYRNVLKTYKEYSDTWLKKDKRIDTDYFLGLSYENAGAYQAALDKYQKVSDRLAKVIGGPLEKEVYVNQYVPRMDNLYLRQAASFFENQHPQESYQMLEKIQKPLDLSEPEQIERVKLASKLYEAKGDTGTAIRYLKELTQLWQGDQNLATPVRFKLAAMQVQNGDVAGAVQTYEKAKEVMLNNKKTSETDVARLAGDYADVLVKNNQTNEAIQMLNEVIDTFNTYPLSQERYKLGDLYFRKGETKKADTAWQKIPEDERNVWKKLSQEKLKQAAWDVNYQKHLKRIPAMSQLEENK